MILSLLACVPAVAAQHSVQHTSIHFIGIPSDARAYVTGFPTSRILDVGPPSIGPNGLHWAARVGIAAAIFTEPDEVLVVDGQTVLAEEDRPGWVPGGQPIDSFDFPVHISNAGAVAFSGFIGDFGSPPHRYVAVRNGQGVFGMVAQGDAPIPGSNLGWIPEHLGPAQVTQAGVLHSARRTNSASPSGFEEALLVAGNTFLRTGVDQPTGQFTGQARNWRSIEVGAYGMTPDGAHAWVLGRLEGPLGSDQVLAIDGAVVMQEGFAIPGGSPAHEVGTDGLQRVFMGPSGDWIAAIKGPTPNNHFVVYNGQVIAQEGAAITPAHTETYQGEFQPMTCNGTGDYVLLGVTDAPAGTARVVVWNGAQVVCRSGDPLDVDGNGLFDDDWYFDTFEAVALSDERTLLLTGFVRNGSGQMFYPYLVEIDLDQGLQAATFCAPAQPNSTQLAARLRAFPSNSGGSGVHLEVHQGPPAEFGYLLAGSQATAPGVVLGAGRLCLGGALLARYNVVGGEHNSIGSFNGAGVLQNLAGTSMQGTGYDLPGTLPTPGMPAITLGSTWHFQYWYRDGVGSSNLTNGLTLAF